MSNFFSALTWKEYAAAAVAALMIFAACLPDTPQAKAERTAKAQAAAENAKVEAEWKAKRDKDPCWNFNLPRTGDEDCSSNKFYTPPKIVITVQQ